VPALRQAHYFSIYPLLCDLFLILSSAFNISVIPYLVRSDIFDKSKVLLKPDGFSGILSAFIKLCEAQYHCAAISLANSKYHSP